MIEFSHAEGDVTGALQAALDAAQGDALLIHPGHYTVGRLSPRSGTRIVMSPGVHLHKRANAGGVLYLDNVEDVHVYANGATIHGEDPNGTTARGHNVYALGTTNCSIRELVSDGASDGKDGLYIGLGQKPNDHLRILGGKYLRAKRNGISVVAGRHTLIADVECAYTTGAPGAGIDVEANYYDHVAHTKILRVHAHDNAKFGIVTTFGTGSILEDCTVHNNGTGGVGFSSGGAEFNDGVYRPNVDLIGIGAFDPATGGVQVSALPPIGAPVCITTRNGAKKPGTLSRSYYVVSRYLGPDTILLGISVRCGEYTSFSDAGEGFMVPDPDVSDVRMLVFAQGQSDGGRVIGGRIYDNAAEGIVVTGSGRFVARDVELRNNAGAQVKLAYTRDIEIDGLSVEGPGRAGISAAGGGGSLAIRRCHVAGTAWKGITVDGWTAAVIEENTVRNCGFADPSSSKAGLHLASCLRPLVSGNTVTQDMTNTTTLFGIYAEHSVQDGVFRHNDLTGAGASAADALRVPAGAVCEGNIGRDGQPA